MGALADRRLLLAAIVSSLVIAACTASTPPPPAPASPVAVGVSPSPVAQTSPAPAQAVGAPVGGGAAQPRVQATSQAIGASAAIIVPTPNFAVNATNVPAGLAPNVALTTPQAAQQAQVTGTLSRIATPIPAVQNSAQIGIIATATANTGGIANITTINVAAAGAAAAGGGGGGVGGGAQTIPAVQTATPVVRAVPAVQPTLAFPGR